MRTMYAILRKWRGAVLYWDLEIPGWHHSPSRASLYYCRSIAEALAFMCCGAWVAEVYVEQEAST